MDPWRTETMIRLAKIALTAGFGLFAALVTWSNVVDPGTNLAFVEHVLRMDTTFRRPPLVGRSIDAAELHLPLVPCGREGHAVEGAERGH